MTVAQYPIFEAALTGEYNVKILRTLTDVSHRPSDDERRTRGTTSR